MLMARVVALFENNHDVGDDDKYRDGNDDEYRDGDGEYGDEDEYVQSRKLLWHRRPYGVNALRSLGQPHIINDQHSRGWSLVIIIINIIIINPTLSMINIPTDGHGRVAKCQNFYTDIRKILL